MRNIRIYTNAPLSVSARVNLPKEDRHTTCCGFCVVGAVDEITLFNGKGGSFPGRIISNSNRVAEVGNIEFRTGDIGSCPDYHAGSWHFTRSAHGLCRAKVRRTGCVNHCSLVH